MVIRNDANDANIESLSQAFENKMAVMDWSNTKTREIYNPETNCQKGRIRNLDHHQNLRFIKGLKNIVIPVIPVIVN